MFSTGGFEPGTSEMDPGAPESVHRLHRRRRSAGPLGEGKKGKDRGRDQRIKMAKDSAADSKVGGLQKIRRFCLVSKYCLSPRSVSVSRLALSDKLPQVNVVLGERLELGRPNLLSFLVEKKAYYFKYIFIIYIITSNSDCSQLNSPHHISLSAFPCPQLSTFLKTRLAHLMAQTTINSTFIMPLFCVNGKLTKGSRLSKRERSTRHRHERVINSGSAPLKGLLSQGICPLILRIC